MAVKTIDLNNNPDESTDLSPEPVTRPWYDNSHKSGGVSSARKWLSSTVILLALLAGIGGGVGGSIVFIRYFGTDIPTSKQQLVVQESSSIVNVASKVSPSVVSITTQQLSQGFFGSTEQVEGAGTGIIVTSNGLILTNKHVVPAGTSSVTVVNSSGKQYTGTVVSRDPINDIAFVRINATGLPAVSLGDSSVVKVGESVVAIGNALGQFQNSVTAGVISGLSRQIQAGSDSSDDSETLQNVFQTDAAINSGNSGGPLVNLAGQVIGMNTAVASNNAQNIGFAIPINDIKSDIASVESQGTIIRPYLGVRYVQLTSDLASENNLSVSQGAWLEADSTGSAVVAGSPADKAGLKDGDIITKVGSTTVDASHTLPTIIGSDKVGSTVALTVIRNGKSQVINVTLGQAPASTN